MSIHTTSKLSMREVTDKARYVEWLNDYTFAVWVGGHTVNFYSYEPNNGNIENFTCINVGSFKNNEATIKEVKNGISSFELYE